MEHGQLAPLQGTDGSEERLQEPAGESDRRIGLQVWQSLLEAAGRGRGDQAVAILFSDLRAGIRWGRRASSAATIWAST